MTRSFGFRKSSGRVEAFTVVNELCEYVDDEAAELDVDAEERGAMDMRFIGNSGTAGGGAAADCLSSAADGRKRRCIGVVALDSVVERRAVRRGLSALLNLPAMACANLLTFSSLASRVGRRGAPEKKPSIASSALSRKSGGAVVAVAAAVDDDEQDDEGMTGERKSESRAHNLAAIWPRPKAQSA